MTNALAHTRIRAPRGHGEFLIEPPLERAAELLAANRDLLAASELSIGGLPLAELAGQARAEMLDSTKAAFPLAADRDRPILLAGHQPQLFHPGVWFKNFVLSQLGRRLNAHAVNLRIDNDTVRSTSLRVPTGGKEAPHVESIAFDRPADEVPFEERTIVDPDLFDSFGERATAALRGLVDEPIVHQLWPLAIAARRRGDGGASGACNLGRCLAEARHCFEAHLGLQTREVSLSRLCDTDSFRRFFLHLIEALPRLRQIYNDCLAEYRRVNRVRSRSHPVPELATEDGWLEAPFWIWSAEQPRRRRLFVRETSGGWELSDRGSFDLSLTAADAIQQLTDAAAAGIRIRPRALTTTLYARLVLGDLFLHGIGGGKYDQLTDAILGRFFGIRPPAFFILSATALLFEDRTAVLEAERELSEYLRREFQFHPEKFLQKRAAAQPLVEAKRRLLSSPPPRGERSSWHREIAELNLAMQHALGPVGEVFRECKADAELKLRHQAPFVSREFSFCLFPPSICRLLLEFSSPQP